MYIVKCYVFADSKNANLVIPYKTKKVQKTDIIRQYRADVIIELKL